MHVCGRAIWLTRALLLVFLALARHARAGEWHIGAKLACSDCHTMHNAKDGQPMRYDEVAAPANRLLRAENATALCLACHRGDSPTSQAPGVLSPSNWDPPGGGFPADLTDPLGQAHSLGPAPLQPPEGDTPVVMTCITCHAPHGNDAHRNLRASPSGTGRSTSAPVVTQTVGADGTNAALVYASANVRYVSDTSQWCMDCHNTLTAHGGLGHPWDRTIFGAVAADWSQWSGEVANRVPVQNPLGWMVTTPNEGDQVFCLSCHKAHGSPNPSALIYADGVDSSSTCQQCHNM